MSKVSVLALQAPLRAQYKSSPETARVTDHARTTGADPGDILCAALAACQDSAVRMVANLLGVELEFLAVEVTVERCCVVQQTLRTPPPVQTTFVMS